MRLSKRLKAETKSEHVLAEATRLAKAFFAGRLDLHAFTLGLVRVEPVYQALERALATSEEPFHRPELYRVDSIRRDLDALGRPAPSHGNAYAMRIDQVARTQPVALLGHFYVRYFADLSGGVTAGRLALKVLRLPKGTRLTYFEFPGISDRTAYKNELRAYLDAVPSSTTT